MPVIFSSSWGFKLVVVDTDATNIIFLMNAKG